VPTVSFMIASLGGYAFHSFATGLGGIVQGTAHASAGDVARGSFNAGQVNYRNVSAGTTSFGNFSGWDIRGFNTSFLQEQMGNITRRGNYMQMVGGKLGDVSEVALHALVNGDRPGYRAYMFAMRALGENAQMGNFEADTKGRILGFTALGKDGISISYRPGEGGTGVVTITIDGKTLATRVNSDGSIEGITTGDISRVLGARFEQSLVQAWAQELANIKKDSEMLSNLISQAEGIRSSKDLEKFYQNVREALKQTRTENAREVLSRIAEAIEEALKKEQGVRRQSMTGEEENLGSERGAGFHVGSGLNLGYGGPQGKGGLGASGGISASFGVSTKEHYYEGKRSYNRVEGTIYRDVNRSQTDRKSQEEAKSEAQRESDLRALGRSIREGLSYALRNGSYEEFSKTVTKALQYTQERLESYRQSLQTAQSIGFEKSLLPAVFNQLKGEEAQKLQNSGLSKEDIEAQAAMNALVRLNNMIEKNPKELFKYLNSVSELPDADKLKEKVEENTPKAGTVGNPPPELRQQVENAENMLKGEYSLNAFVVNKRQADALAKKLTQLTGRQAEVIKTGKGYMVSVGGFHSEDIAKGLAQGLGLKNYQVVKVEPQQHQPQQQQPQQQPQKVKQ
jgi:hypothetical protein